MSGTGDMLQVEYSTQEAFRAEYVSNISRGGIFIATDRPLEERQLVDVELSLYFCDTRLVLEGEIVHVIPPEMAAAGGTPGVAVQFLMPVGDLRAELDPHVGEAGSADERVSKTGRRAAPRSRARVNAVVEYAGDASAQTCTRDISSSGLLLAVQGDPIQIGESIALTLDHPVTGEKMNVEGRIVRHVKSASGEVTAMGVEFAHPEARQSEVSSFVNDVQAAEHSRRLGGINGPVAELGIADLLQMFGASTSEGTLSVVSPDDEGTIGFAGGQLLWSEFGGLSGSEALEHMLLLREGHFEFQMNLEEPVGGRDDPKPLDAAVLGVLCSIDERRAKEAKPTAARKPKPKSKPKRKSRKKAKSAPQVESQNDRQHIARIKTKKVSAREAVRHDRPSKGKPDGVAAQTRFRIDREALEECQGELDQTRQAVVDLAKVGMSVSKMVEIIPENELGIMMAIDELLARGVLELE